MKECLLALGFAFMTILSVPASYPANPGDQKDEDSTYTRVITERSARIVRTLGLPDSLAAIRVRGIIVDQYRALNTIYTDRDTKLKTLKNQQPAPDKSTVDSAKKDIEKEAETSVQQLHAPYLARLGKELTPAQVDKVKDGMTYSVLEVTYRAYQEMLPSLTEQQKARILSDLTEAREHAMDAGSSEKKHAWFGKYKGRINNYLSAEGIDMKKAGEEWAQRNKH